MRTLAWQQFFTEQREQHGKVIFSVAELANVSQTSLHNVNTELGRLVQRGLITRYAHGRYGLPKGVETETIIASIDSSAYITGHYALFLNQVVTQVPTEIACFTSRRHNRQKNCVAPAGKVQFVCVPSCIYNKPPGATSASAEQAFCDFCWLALRKGIEPQSLVTFKNLHNLNFKNLCLCMKNYPEEVRQAVTRIIQSKLGDGSGQMCGQGLFKNAPRAASVAQPSNPSSTSPAF
ncbi:MAG TPA: hypothetical protein VN578_14930 [Candidatus Binatia bacterium]|jgi:hypothetical protein|nr:hypothetical protein [Candidatus Binatia bacterium]